MDFYGFHAAAGGCFVGGWLSHPWRPGDPPRNASAAFEQGMLTGHEASAYYHRSDVAGRGIGFVYFLRAGAAPSSALLGLTIVTADGPRCLRPAQDARSMGGPALVTHLLGLLQSPGDREQLAAMRALVTAGQPADLTTGAIDLYGFSPLAGGWFFAGWFGRPWPAGCSPTRAAATISARVVEGECLCALHTRDDVPSGADGFVAFLRTDVAEGRISALSITAGDWQADTLPTAAARVLRGPALAAELSPLLAQETGADRDALAGLLARQPYRGQETLPELQPPIRMAIDQAITVGSTGLVLMGWLLAQPGWVRAIRVCTATSTAPLDLGTALRIDRADVLSSHAGSGVTDPDCGFIAYLPDAGPRGDRLWLEVEAASGVGFLPIQDCGLSGLAAIKQLLAAADLRFAAVRPAFDRVLGPAVAALNEARLASPPGVETVAYGSVPPAARYSIVIPLYGRLDYVEYQLALFSAHPASAAIEFIYVLDEPARRQEAQFLFASVHERYGLPFRAVFLTANLGFAPATNIGLSMAGGEFVVLMNSDVFPGPPDWLDRLTAHLDADPSIGVIGPTLLFEDGSVQHQGMAFQAVAEFGGLHFGIHTGKGLRPAEPAGLLMPPCITGACMVLRRSLAIRLGGLDERYVIGDFEDSDLCLRLADRGLRCAVDPQVALIHLERRSQASSALGWRMGVTVYNAWQHDRRWRSTIAALEG